MTLRKEYVEAIAEVSRIKNPLDRVNALARKLLVIDNPGERYLVKALTLLALPVSADSEFGPGDTVPYDGAAFTYGELLRNAVRNAGRLSHQKQVRYAHVAEALGVPGMSAAGLCEHYGLDPHEVLGCDDDDDDDDDESELNR